MDDTANQVEMPMSNGMNRNQNEECPKEEPNEDRQDVPQVVDDGD